MSPGIVFSPSWCPGVSAAQLAALAFATNQPEADTIYQKVNPFVTVLAADPNVANPSNGGEWQIGNCAEGLARGNVDLELTTFPNESPSLSE